MQPNMVYATSRQTNSILSWDIRGDTSSPLQRFERHGMTNQRINFDLDIYGSSLITGDTVSLFTGILFSCSYLDQNGYISSFDLSGETPDGKPISKFRAHEGKKSSSIQCSN